MYHKFRGRRWRVKDDSDLNHRVELGLCEWDIKTISAPIHKGGLLACDVIIHEALHACLPDLSEDAVNETASDIAKLLIKLGWSKL